MFETDMVKKSYNKIAASYYSHRDLSKFNGELDKFVDFLPKNGHVLDVGCGAGIPTGKYLVSRGLKVTGIDISDTMLEMARKNVPEAEFINKDMNNLDFNKNSFDGIISVYALFHVPKNNHPNIFKQFFKILKPGGILLFNTGTSESEGVSKFFGEPMFWSNYDPKKTLEIVKSVGFSILFEGVLVRGGEFQYWIFAKK
ncbi:MAG: class I SAM-dependent methyltransferase [Promethearchaeota archaeon]|jgi:ubiquinone/menaquinone biosynthesis C-methylase UbiE